MGAVGYGIDAFQGSGDTPLRCGCSGSTPKCGSSWEKDGSTAIRETWSSGRLWKRPPAGARVGISTRPKIDIEERIAQGGPVADLLRLIRELHTHNLEGARRKTPAA